MRTFRIIEGDALTGAKSIPDGTVAVCVTSPPYYGLRAYGTQPQAWGGAADCEHVWGEPSGYVGHRGNRGQVPQTINPSNKTYPQNTGDGQSFCSLCGAWRGELGQEPTPEMFIAHLVEVFRGVRRVLRDDGTLWVNIGDSYASTGRSDQQRSPKGTAGQEVKAPGRAVVWGKERHDNFTWMLPGGQKPKDLIGIPWMLAFALRADGWYLRQELIWHKPNPMPESVTDRCTKAHEQIFLLSKSPRYHFDADAIAEQAIHAGKVVSLGEKSLSRGQQNGQGLSGHWGNALADSVTVKDKRNRRSVWTVATKPFSEAHFAVFPPELIEPCILAGSKEGDTVYDPFTGSGTTGLVALRHGRHFIGSELNPEYAAMARRRIFNDAPLLNREEAA